jgi:hypothetical protein
MLGSESDDDPRVEHPVRVELHALGADRDGKIEDSIGTEQRRQIRHAATECARIDGVAGAAQPEMLKGLETRERITQLGRRHGSAHQVRLPEGHPRNARGDRPDADLDLAKARHVSDEPVDA